MPLIQHGDGVPRGFLSLLWMWILRFFYCCIAQKHWDWSCMVVRLPNHCVHGKSWTVYGPHLLLPKLSFNILLKCFCVRCQFNFTFKLHTKEYFNFCCKPSSWETDFVSFSSNSSVTSSAVKSNESILQQSAPVHDLGISFPVSLDRLNEIQCVKHTGQCLTHVRDCC